MYSRVKTRFSVFKRENPSFINGKLFFYELHNCKVNIEDLSLPLRHFGLVEAWRTQVSLARESHLQVSSSCAFICVYSVVPSLQV